MQQREKILAGALGGVVALYFVWPAVSAVVMGPITEREQELAAAQRSETKAADEADETLAAVQAVGTYRETALSGPPVRALRSYHEWLTDLALACGWSNVELRPIPRSRPINEAATPVEVRGGGVATADQLAEFLTRYEEAAILHGLTRLAISSESAEPDSPLTIELASEAVVLDGADEHAWQSDPPPETSEAWAAIAASNPFTRPRPPEGPPENAPPVFEGLAATTVEPGGTVRTQFRVRDPDGDDDAVVVSVDRLPEGASYDEAARTLTFTPPDGDDGRTRDLRLMAVDQDGRRTRQSWSVRVEENPAGKVELVGSFVVDTEPVAWLVDRKSGTRLEVRAGDALQFGRIDGRVEAIERRSLEYTDAGQRYRWKLGQTLADAVPM